MAEARVPRWLQRVENRYQMLEDGNIKTETSLLDSPISPGSFAHPSSIAASEASSTSEQKFDLRLSSETAAPTADAISVDGEKVVFRFPLPPTAGDDEIELGQPETQDEAENDTSAPMLINDGNKQIRKHHRRSSSADAALPRWPGSDNISRTFLAWRAEVKETFAASQNESRLSVVPFHPGPASRALHYDAQKAAKRVSVNPLRPATALPPARNAFDETAEPGSRRLRAPSTSQLDLWM